MRVDLEKKSGKGVTDALLLQEEKTTLENKNLIGTSANDGL